MPAKKGTKKEKVISGKSISKEDINSEVKNIWEKIKGLFQGIKWGDNLQKILGVILLIIGLYQLRTWLVGLLLVIFGVLFITGYFEKK